MKVYFFEKYIIGKWLTFVATISSLIATLFIFMPHLEQKMKNILFIAMIVLYIFIYIGIYFYYIFKKEISITINNTKVNVLFGDIFKMEGKKVIAFNEYFDTLVDEKIITSNSLNGQLINRYLPVETIDISVSSNADLVKGELNVERKIGNKQKYKLGQIHVIRDWFLLSFSRFNSKNEAELNANEYANCLLEMWKNLNQKYAQTPIYIPLLGDGITRIRDNMTISKQDLLETMLFTLKISMKTFKEPSEINIVLYSGPKNENYSKFNFARIKYLFK